MKCVFFGSPEFAVASLDALLASNHEVAGIVTQPDRPAGRGLKLEPPAVKVRALEKNIPILQPEKVNREETYSFLERLAPDILVVVAYGGFLGEKLLKFCKFPPVNVHPSLLPDLRGAAPMQWAVLKGYANTGVTTQFMVKEMDAGDVLLQVPATIGENESAKELQDRLKVVGGNLIVATLDGLEKGSITPRKQDGSKATLAPLLSKEQGLIHFAQETAQTIHNQVRGLFPWPGAYTYLNKKRIKILQARMAPGKAGGRGGVFWFEEERLFVHCREGALEILRLQPEGKPAILPREFENGMKTQGLAQVFDSGDST
ncbi:MAG: methionyl-tRNA formyltransferase [Bacteriovoracia bacterium]